MQKYHLVKQEVYETCSLTCDKCHKEFMSEKPDPIEGHSVAGTTFSIDFGWGSRYDGDYKRIDLCDDCCEKLLEEFLDLPPEKTGE
jgi:hypothetical protein